MQIGITVIDLQLTVINNYQLASNHKQSLTIDDKQLTMEKHL